MFAFSDRRSGDNFETLTISKPKHLLEPPAVVKDPEHSLADFEERAASIAQVTRTMRRTRQSAQKLQSVVKAALGDFDLDQT